MPIAQVEFQLLRDWEPRSRPSRGEVHIGEGLPTPDVVKLYQGAAAVGMESMFVYVENATRVSVMWATARVGVTLDGTLIGEPRPVMWWLGLSDSASGVIHYPVIAGNDNLMFKGRHTLLLRTVE